MIYIDGQEYSILPTPLHPSLPFLPVDTTSYIDVPRTRIDVFKVEYVNLTVIDENGTKIVIRARTDAKVDRIKDKIVAEKQVEKKLISLMYEGRNMDVDYFSLYHYGIERDSVIHMEIGVDLYLSVVIPEGNTITITAKSFTCIENVKHILSLRLLNHTTWMTVPPDVMILSFEGSILDDKKTLTQCGIRTRCTIQLSGYTPLTLSIEFPDGVCKPVNVWSFQLIRDLRHSLPDYGKMHRQHNLSFLYGDIELKDSETIASYGIKSGDTLTTTETFRCIES